MTWLVPQSVRGLQTRLGTWAGRHRRPIVLAAWGALLALAPVLLLFLYVYCYPFGHPDIEPLVRFELPTIGHVYDSNGQPLIALAREYRWIVQYSDIPPVVREAILAAEDKRFFRHDGLDFASLPRVLSKARLPAVFPQGGSTITQQLVRGYFLQPMLAREHTDRAHRRGFDRVFGWLFGGRSFSAVVRKIEEARLSVWVEREMRHRFGSKRRAKDELLARYASLIYMGHGQYGFTAASEYYFGQPLKSLTIADADKAAILAGIAKAPRDYAPDAAEAAGVIRRRNQILELMAERGALTKPQEQAAAARPIDTVAHEEGSPAPTVAPAAVAHAIQELATEGLTVNHLLRGEIQIYSTVDERIQQIATQALENGLLAYERRHPKSKGQIQGAVVVLRNNDAAILAEIGGRQIYNHRSASYVDFNRVTSAMRQPGSAMKPLVYLTAFREGGITLDTVVPDEPISVPTGKGRATKTIVNYDGQYKGMIPVREALAESRNAVAIWLSTQVGISSILRTSRTLGVVTPLKPYPTTALGASEVSLIEIANAYRAMASGLLAEPHIIHRIEPVGRPAIDEPVSRAAPPRPFNDAALVMIQEGLRGVVRMPTGTAHALDSTGFPPVMGKTGTTSDYRDALFIGSTYGPDGITIAVRIGFDDDRSLGVRESGSLAALPIFREAMSAIYRQRLVGPAPRFPDAIEASISASLAPPPESLGDAVTIGLPQGMTVGRAVGLQSTVCCDR